MQSGEVVTFGHATLGWSESKRQIEALLLERATCGFGTQLVGWKESP